MPKEWHNTGAEISLQLGFCYLLFYVPILLPTLPHFSTMAYEIPSFFCFSVSKRLDYRSLIAKFMALRGSRGRYTRFRFGTGK